MTNCYLTFSSRINSSILWYAKMTPYSTRALERSSQVFLTDISWSIVLLVWSSSAEGRIILVVIRSNLDLGWISFSLSSQNPSNCCHLPTSPDLERDDNVSCVDVRDSKISLYKC
eukprot:sb/3476698/